VTDDNTVELQRFFMQVFVRN